ncbi:MAG: protein-ADP-ribose hydrolase [Oscillospiraceae bacterium]|nr:protein-ADP-ribose hydrolase [Oscillospiraceae bacterium]
MDQEQRRVFLIRELLKEEPRYSRVSVPEDAKAQKDLLRSLMNVRPPRAAGEDFIAVQDEYLKTAIAEKGVTRLEELKSEYGELYLWQGDITTLACGAIVNAANSGMTGCYRPLHNCIDNCIHTFSGVQLRLKCAELIEAQGHEEPTGRAKITPAYNLPSDFVIHTVGPIADGPLTDEHCSLLASCYRSCLELAEANGCESIAFCCISTGVFGFPKKEAAQIAVGTVKEYKRETGSPIKVVFNVFKDDDLAIYRNILRFSGQKPKRTVFDDKQY